MLFMALSLSVMPPRHRLRFRRCRRLVALLVASITIGAAPRSSDAGTFPCIPWTGSNCVFPRPFDCSSVNACATVWPLYELSYHDVANSARFSNVTSNVRVFLMGILYRPSHLKFQGFRHKQADRTHCGRNSRSSNNESGRRVVHPRDRCRHQRHPRPAHSGITRQGCTTLHLRHRLSGHCPSPTAVFPAEGTQPCTLNRDWMPLGTADEGHSPPRAHNPAPST